MNYIGDSNPTNLSQTVNSTGSYFNTNMQVRFYVDPLVFSLLFVRSQRVFSFGSEESWQVCASTRVSC